MDTKTKKPQRVALLGNIGVGKSFLGNCLVGKEVFLHGSSPNSVTQKTEEYPLVHSRKLIFSETFAE
jgi:hypothetical protein